VSNSGTTSAAVFNFTVPRGNTGDTGPANSLAIGTVTTVAAGGSATASVTGSAPSQTLNLGLPTGATGTAATIAVNSTTTGAAGTSASVVNVGTSGAASLNFTIPQGTKGDTGATGDWSTAQTINAQTGTTYTIVSTDPGKLVTLTNAAAIAVTVPTGVATVGQRIDLAQLGAGQVTVGAGSGVTILATPTAKLRTQWSAATLICIAATATPTATYLLVGDLAAV
jgi:hypothetical protein